MASSTHSSFGTPSGSSSPRAPFGSSSSFDSTLSTSPSFEQTSSSSPKKTSFIGRCIESVSPERKRERNVSGSRPPHEQTEIANELSRKLSDAPDSYHRRDSDGKNKRPSRSKSPRIREGKDKAQKSSEAFFKIYDKTDPKEASEYSNYPQRRSSGTKSNKSLTALKFQELTETPAKNSNDPPESPKKAFSGTKSKRPLNSMPSKSQEKTKTSAEFLSPRGNHFDSHPLVRSKSPSLKEIPKPKSKNLSTIAKSEDDFKREVVLPEGELDFLINKSKKEITEEEKFFLNLPLKKNKELDHAFLQKVEKNEYSTLICTQHQLLEAYKEIQMEILLPQIKKYSIFSDIEDVENFFLDMLIKLQNELLQKCNIRQRLLDLSECLVKFALQRECKTPLMQFTYITLEELISISTQKDGFIFTNKIEEFCDYISKINKQELLPKSSKKSKKLISIFSFLTNEMLEFLRACSDKQITCNKFRDFFLEQLFKKVVDNIHKLKNLWSEPATQNGFFKSIDAISINDVVTYYCREGVPLPITIFIGKEQLIFPLSDMDDLSDEDFEREYFIQFFSQLYKASGYGIKPLIIHAQVEELLKKEESDLSKLNPETLACIRLMKMGCVEVWSKAHHYFNWRLGELEKTSYTSSTKSVSNPLKLKEENIQLQFHVDQKNPANSFVQQYKIFEIHRVRDQSKIAKVPTKLKVFAPNSQNETWNFQLTFESVTLINDCNESSDDLIRDVKYYFVNFKNDEDVQSRISKADRNYRERKLKTISNQEEADNLNNSFVSEIKIGHSFC